MRGDEPKTIVDIVSLECYSQSEVLDKALRELVDFVLMVELHSILSNVHQYSLPDSTVLQWDLVKNWSSAFRVPLTFAGFPVQSVFAPF